MAKKGKKKKNFREVNDGLRTSPATGRRAAYGKNAAAHRKARGPAGVGATCPIFLTVNGNGAANFSPVFRLTEQIIKEQ